MTDVVTRYAEFMRSWGAAEMTIIARTRAARSRLKAWGLEGHTQANIEQWLAVNDRGERRTAWTRATYYNHMVSWCEFLAAARLLPADPMLGVRKPQQGKNKPHPLSEPEVARVLDAAEGRTLDWIVIALKTGMRVHEIAKLAGADVSEEGIWVVGKGGTDALLPCPPEVLEMAERYPRHGYWFPGGVDGHLHRQRITETVSVLYRSVGITKGSIHRCRHTFCTRLLRAGVHIRTVQQLMRHASLATTANYAAVDEDELRAAVAKLPRIPLRSDEDTGAAAA